MSETKYLKAHYVLLYTLPVLYESRCLRMSYSPKLSKFPNILFRIHKATETKYL